MELLLVLIEKRFKSCLCALPILAIIHMIIIKTSLSGGKPQNSTGSNDNNINDFQCFYNWRYQ